jgi:hypothetical protein
MDREMIKSDKEPINNGLKNKLNAEMEEKSLNNTSNDMSQGIEHEDSSDNTSKPSADKATETKKGTSCLRNDRHRKITRISLWVSVLMILFAILLWILHNWLGYWLVIMHRKYENHQNKPSSMWSAQNLPLWLVGKGLLRGHNSVMYFPINRKNAFPFLLKYINDDNAIIRIRVLYLLESMIALHYENIEKDKLIPKMLEALKDNDFGVRNYAVTILNKIEEPSVIPYLIEAWQKESNIGIKHSLENTIRYLKYGDISDPRPIE